jgi:hypothetical protein
MERVQEPSKSVYLICPLRRIYSSRSSLVRYRTEILTWNIFYVALFDEIKQNHLLTPAVTMGNTVFWDVTPCSPVQDHDVSEESKQAWSSVLYSAFGLSSILKSDGVGSSETSRHRVAYKTAKDTSRYYAYFTVSIRNSSVDIVTGNGMGFIPSGGKIFLIFTASRPALGLTQPLIQWVPGGSFGIKTPGE